MARTLDKDYTLTEFTKEQTISKDSFTTIYDLNPQRGYLDCIIFKVSDTNMKLIIDVDGRNVVDEFTLKDFASIYGLSTDFGFSLPLTSIDSKTFRYKPTDYQEFETNITIKLKHNSKSDKELEAGYITYQKR
jgi:hypothetical protein